MLKFKKSTALYFLFSLVLIFSSCADKEDQTPVNDGSNQSVNRWIKDVMDQVYYWLDDMRTPIASNSDPEDYFESLLFRPTDRFSVIYPNYQELINSLQGTSQEAGYEFSLVQTSQDGQVTAFVTYIKPNSPAEDKGLLRGDAITQINGTSMTTSNFQSVIGQVSEPHSITYSRFNEEQNAYVQVGTTDLETIQISENPNFLDTIYTVDNHKIGYVVYHFFAPGVTGQPEIYDNQTDAIFEKFKAEGVNQLVLDFRYNGGGFVSSAVNLASLIAPNINSQSIFSKTKYNSFLSDFDDFQNVQTLFRTKSQNIGNQLADGKVYILTSTRTASASELIINGLRPYTDIVIIGGKTTGKNVGSAPLEDEDNPSNNYGILPIISQSFNSLDQSDYGTGFVPDFQIREIDNLPFKQFGDTNDPLLRIAIEQITGNISGGRMNFMKNKDLGSSLDDKIRQGNLIEDSENINKSIKKALVGN